MGVVTSHDLFKILVPLRYLQNGNGPPFRGSAIQRGRYSGGPPFWGSVIPGAAIPEGRYSGVRHFGGTAIPGVRHSGAAISGATIQGAANHMSACGHPKSSSHVDDKKHASKLGDGLPEE